jgi:hypothetical protein
LKAKPNTDQFNPKKDLSNFLEGGAADVADRRDSLQIAQVSALASAKVHREQKVFRLPMDIILALKRESYELSVKTGNRVTETELVEKALRAYIAI